MRPNTHIYTVCRPFEKWASKRMLGLKMNFGLKIGFLDHILGSIKSLDSTHDVDHFGNNLFSHH